MKLFSVLKEPKTNLSVKCKVSTKQKFLELCEQTQLPQSDFFESAIALLYNPTNANWKQWQIVYQNRKTEKNNRPTEDELLQMSVDLKNNSSQHTVAEFIEIMETELENE